MALQAVMENPVKEGIDRRKALDILREMDWSRVIFSMLIVLSLAGSAQTYNIRGVVIDGETRQAIPYAHVFINNTTLGSVTDEQGRFDFRHGHEGPGQLIVSFMGYETFSQPLASPRKDLNIQIRLKPSQAALEAVTVAATEDKEWQRNLKTFRKEFLGKTANAASCEIINPWVLEFRKKGGLFQADASAPLQIQNKALGYEMIFYLNQFETSADRYSIVGPVRFGEMQSTTDDKAWQAKRTAAFQGSVKHFFKLLWKNQHNENGFRIYRSVNALEEEQRTPYFERDLGVRVREVRREDLVRDDPKGGLIFFSIRPVEIHYEPARDFEPVYRDLLHQVSWIQAAGGSIRFDSTGNILNPQDVIVSGYWNRLRVGDLLPLDYIPGGKRIEHEPERLVIVPDKSVYNKGSQAWYTVLVSGMSPSVHVQLVDSIGRVVGSRLDPVENGRAAGAFSLPSNAGTYYLRAISSSTSAEGNYFVKPLVVTGDTRDLICQQREGSVRVDWRLDSIHGKEMLALSMVDPDRDTLQGDFSISITGPGSDCNCLDGKWLSFPKPGTDPRPGSVHAGKVTNKRGQTLSGKLVFFTSDLSSSVERDLGKEGRFRLDDMVMYDTTTWLAQLYDEKDKAVEDFEITWDEEWKPAWPRLQPWDTDCSWSIREEPAVVVRVGPLADPRKLRDELMLNDSVRLLSEVTVRGRRIKSSDKKPETTFRSYGNAQYVVKGVELENAPVGTNLLNTLAARAPGLIFSEGNNNWGGGKSVIRVRGKQSFRMQEDPLIILDGMPMDNFDLAWDVIQAIPLTDIDRVEVRTSLAAMQGLKGNNGIISVYTKRQKGSMVTSRPSAFVRQVRLAGYSKPPVFVRDSTAGATLHWQAEVPFGKQPVLIDTSLLPEEVDITLSGFNNNGEIVFIRKRIAFAEQRDQLGSTSN